MSKIISFDYGHAEGGQDVSANGLVYEYKVNRDYGKVCIDTLTRSGFTCVNCTPPNGSMTLGQSLSYRVNKANASGSILHLCFHANCFDDSSAHGSEIEIGGSSGTKYASAILTEIHKLGFAFHGSSINEAIKTPSLYVTKHTSMTALLIEPFFISSKVDVALYSAATLGNACANGVLKVLGGKVIVSAPVAVIPTIIYRKAVTITKDCNAINSLGAIAASFKVGDQVTIVNSEGNYFWTTIGKFPQTSCNLLVAKAPVVNDETYRVITGSFADKANADKRVEELKRAGVESFVTTK